MDQPILEMHDILKVFPGVKALEGVHLKIYSGQVMALIGENGAGKSTLMKILSGVYKKDGGEIYYKGERIDIKDPKHAQQLAIAIIHQELNLIPHLSVAENIFLGREYIHSITKKIDWKKMHEESRKLLDALNIDVKSTTLVEELSIGKQQMIEIAKALSLNAEIIIMDEPTDALTTKETESLFNAINKLKLEGKAIIYISHRMEEIFEICDYYTVLRDGKYVSSDLIENTDEEGIIQMMVGRKLEDKFPRIINQAGTEILKVININNEFVKDISFSLKKGEVLGIAGLMGAGRTELAKTIFGAIKMSSGEMYIDNHPLKIKHPKDAIDAGIAYTSENRKEEGLILELSVKDNMTLSSLKELLGVIGRIDGKKEKGYVKEYVEKMQIKTPGIHQIIKNLSGGNQQKVVLSKWMMTNPKVLILDEPTRGVDVGAKTEIYRLINELKKKDVGIIVISSELPELLGITDRIVVMYQGRITGEFDRDEATQERIMKCAVGN
ncbi:sugar ABC transporter ATP-binding protein [Natronincola ferrireducens]|uniref:Ribose transport system ATP-binding protein n=1 Tax=Natronincola ferrireducens TaxID=393762 RepID=A0A1G9GT84_9FIRM|nr:ATP-binding cassette domain-containing protein [Natronincola ferrireducens]SDL03910.1 ribose transport system ATP-binding protein [Natronincola ferrireducens]